MYNHKKRRLIKTKMSQGLRITKHLKILPIFKEAGVLPRTLPNFGLASFVFSSIKLSYFITGF